MSQAILNINATTFLNSPVTISLSGLIKADAVIKNIIGNASNFGQNVTYIPPLDFSGADTIECNVTDGNKVVITVTVLPRPKDAAPEKIVRRQVRTTTMAGKDPEKWEIESDTGEIVGPSAASVPLEIKNVTALGSDPDTIPTATSYFSTIGMGSWIQLDLGHLCNVSEIKITWHSPCNFSLAVSNDRKKYVNVYQGRGIGINNIKTPRLQAITIKITLMEGVSDKMETDSIEIRGSPISPRPTQTGAQAVLQYSAQIAESQQIVVMDGSDSRGDITKVVWSQDSGPAVILFNQDTKICSFIAPDVEEPTTFQFSLTIVDRNSQYSKAESLIHITPKPKILGISGIALTPLDISGVALTEGGWKDPFNGKVVDLAKLDKFYNENPCCREEEEASS